MEVDPVANEMVLHEMFTRKIESETLARQLGLTEKELASVLRFDLSEEEQLRLLWLIDELASAKMIG